MDPPTWSPTWSQCPACGMVERGTFIFCHCVTAMFMRHRLVTFDGERSEVLEAAYRIGGIAAAQCVAVAWGINRNAS